MTKFFFLVFTFSLFLCSCSSQTEQKIISKIFKEDDVRKAGKLLQSLPMGLTLLNATNNQADTVFVAVHGYASEGYEWIKPLRKIMQKGFQLYYYRWDWNTCPDYAERKLLLNKREVNKLIGKMQRDGFTIVPTKMYFKNGKAKIELAVAKGKKQFDKRAAKKNRDWNRDKARYIRKSS